MNADGSGKRNLTRNRASDDYPTWSPDGRRIAFLRASGSYGTRSTHLYVMNADGSGLLKLSPDRGDPAHVLLVSWSGHRTGGRSTSGATSSAPTGAERGSSRTSR